MHGLTIVKSLLVRVFLLAHGLLCTWRVIDTSDNQYCWIILAGLGFLLVETGIVIWLRNGHEFKTVAFCIIFYLSCIIPSLWLIHIETANRKLFHLAEDKLNARATPPPIHYRQQHSISNSTLLSDGSAAQMSHLLAATTPVIISIGHVECHDKAWYYMDEQRWLDALQETMFIVLCITRLVISREHMSVAKSGIVLFVTLVNSIDLLAMSHSLQYHDIIIERIWMYVGLALLSIGLFQMAFIDTDGLAPITDQLTLDGKRKLSKRIHFLQDQTICPLFRSLFIHDGLLLLYRTLLVARIRCSKPTIIFFMAKNVLVMTLHCYRVYRISKDRHKKRTFAAYENLINAATMSRKYRHPFYGFEKDRPRKQQQNQQRLLHRTLRQPMSINHRRMTKTPRTLRTFSLNSISYPFARRRNDGGRARTAFALYGLPFHAPEAPQPATISSASSLIAKAFVH
ncbi:unnamed protein product [Rotaria magnacalcarata]|uniref:Transmembrane protein 26 n=3 Tax=Rotaria magnacalcarata TaxID=392030 RepID=A0A819Y8I4_9BILA|nr:unnamed protein product [Rotaria magnacalcarata]CAF1643844.1 unnamed protein product [Rotaria magnacalcarata]CAF2089382.1 unnamed protein product [Rotaria magnacalcarata]CAF2155579.1 unnamed protein product [Rotaria magnacalcarata]CAF2268892.1 unnamed protein product [Rotaria magnacalcarata]